MGIGVTGTGTPAGAIPGAAAAVFGGAVTLVGVGMQVIGGVLQLWSDPETGQRNVTAGSFSIATAGVATSYSNAMMRGGNNYLSRAYNANVNSGSATAGAVIDALQSIPRFLQPQQAKCEESGN